MKVANTSPKSAASTDAGDKAWTRAGAGRRQRLPLSRLFVVAGILVIAALLPILLSDYWISIAAQVVIFAVATLGLDVLFGRTGQLSMAHASFMGLGAYVTVIASQHGVGVLPALGLVIVAALVAGAVVAVPTLRLSGLRLALVTLVFGELFVWFIDNTTSVTGGSEGITAPPLIIGRFDTTLPVDAYELAIISAAVATLITLQLARTQLGRRMLAVRDSELAARSAGVNVVRTKITSFIYAAVFAGVAGWLYSVVMGFISPTTFDLFPSVYFLVAVLLGGAGTVVGAWLGAGYIVLVPQLFTLIGHPNLFPILGGAVLVLVALLLPGGLVSVGTQLSRLVRVRSDTSPAPPSAPATASEEPGS